MAFPKGQPPELPDRFSGRPKMDGICPEDCHLCQEVCPVGAIQCREGQIELDLGRCLFCHACVESCPQVGIHFTRNYQLGASSERN